MPPGHGREEQEALTFTAVLHTREQLYCCTGIAKGGGRLSEAKPHLTD